jgi:hypothetical protein
MVLHPSYTIVSAAPLDFVDLPYSPALLLDAGFDASITDCLDFRDACQDGFGSYFEEGWEDDGQGNEVFTNHFNTWHEVRGEIVGAVARRYDAVERFHEQQLGGVVPLSWRAGFALGWLSALALADRALALRGIGLLAWLVPSCQREEAKRAA